MKIVLTVILRLSRRQSKNTIQKLSPQQIMISKISFQNQKKKIEQVKKIIEKLTSLMISKKTQRMSSSALEELQEITSYWSIAKVFVIFTEKVCHSDLLVIIDIICTNSLLLTNSCYGFKCEKKLFSIPTAIFTQKKKSVKNDSRVL